MSLDAQAKVLRVIEEQRVQRVGGSEPIPVDVRLVAATNKDLKKESDEGTFREDLYYRLAVVPVVVPPLRERGGDVAMLAQTFLQQVAERMGREPPQLTDTARKWLERQEWPGNVRQLRNVMERCVILVDGLKIEVKDLEGMTSASTAAAAPDVFRTAQSFEEFKNESERLFLQMRLQSNDWNVKRTAESLGMQRSNLYKKMDRYGLK